ncbi:MAG: ribonuclease P protein component [Candidatus Kaiserbacteria bacterium]|nr:ribonuclease P protein component [Candidatus Kaiserbacteria bacterium]
MKLSLRREEVQHILKHGKRYTCDGFVVCVLRSDASSGRFSILIPKKVAKGAVARNRVRRVLRDVISCVGYTGSDFVVLHNKKQDSEEVSKEHLRTLLTTIAHTV